MESYQADLGKVLELARQIVELDLERDKKWERLTALVGGHAYDVLRKVQNS